MSKRRVAIVGALVLLVVAGIAVNWLLPPLHSSFEVGMTKQQLLERFGESWGRQTLVKDEAFYVQSHILFINEIPEGTEFEIWVYKSLGGRTLLVFVEGSDRANYVAYWRNGADYFPPFFPGRRKPPANEADADDARR